MKHSKPQVLIDLDEYNELTSLNDNYNKFVFLLLVNDLRYSIDMEYVTEVKDYRATLYIYTKTQETANDYKIENWELGVLNVGDTFTSQLSGLFDAGIDYLQTLKQ